MSEPAAVPAGPPAGPRSMTGFGSARAEGPFGAVVVEVRTVNHRHLDVAFHLPRSWSTLEEPMRRAVSRRLERGRVDIGGYPQDPAGLQRRVRLQPAVLAYYWHALSDIQRQLGIAGSLSLAELVGLPEVVAIEEPPAADPPLVEAACRALEQALDQVEAMRAAEGLRLWADVADRLARVEQQVARLRVLSAQATGAYRDRLEARVAELLSASGGDTPALLEALRQEEGWQRRLAQEVTLAAERCDIEEELTRLASHAQQMRRLAQGAAGGRRMEFLLREMDREAATATSKAASSEMVHELIEMRWELERIREQVLNLE